MPETELGLKQKTLEQLRYHRQHYHKVYPHAKQQGKVVLRQYLKRLNRQIQCQQDDSSTSR